MNKKFLILNTVAIGFIFVEGCVSHYNSDKPWDKPIREDNRPGYKSDDTFPLNRDAK